MNKLEPRGFAYIEANYHLIKGGLTNVETMTTWLLVLLAKQDPRYELLQPSMVLDIEEVQVCLTSLLRDGQVV